MPKNQIPFYDAKAISKVSATLMEECKDFITDDALIPFLKANGKDIRQQHKLKWNAPLEVLFDYPDKRKIGKPFYLKISWIIKGQRTPVRECFIPLEIFKYRKH